MNKEAPWPSTNIGIKFSGEDLEGVQHNHHITRKAGEKEEDEESVLSNIEHQEGDLNNLDISDYCISSDAETEKMSDDKIQQGLDNRRPHISDLMGDFEYEEQKDKKRGKLEDENEMPEERKKIKIEERANNGSELQHVDGQTLSAAEKNTSSSANSICDSDSNNYSNDDGNDSVNEKTQNRDEENSEESGKPIPTHLNQLSQLEEEPREVFEKEKIAKDLMQDRVGEEGTVEENHVEEEEGDVEEDHVEEEEGEVDEDQMEEEEVEVEEDHMEEEEEEVEEDQIEEDEDEEELEKKQLTAFEEENNTVLENDNQEDKPMSSMPSPIEIEQLRLSALKEITEIEYKFVELRQKLYDNKLQRLQTELQMCREGSHPDLQSYYQKIASIRDYKLRRAYQRQKYELKCIDKETRATRTFIHQDFIRHVSDIRNQLLNETTQKWYDINKERRDMDIFVPEVNYHVPIKIAGKTLSCITGYAGPAQQRYPGEPLTEDLECENIRFRYRSNAVDKLEVIVDRMRLNNELSDLEGLRKYFNGFPGAPELSGLRDSEVFDDLQELPPQRQ